jgi:hypothetical protein
MLWKGGRPVPRQRIEDIAPYIETSTLTMVGLNFYCEVEIDSYDGFHGDPGATSEDFDRRPMYRVTDHNRRMLSRNGFDGPNYICYQCLRSLQELDGMDINGSDLHFTMRAGRAELASWGMSEKKYHRQRPIKRNLP